MMHEPVLTGVEDLEIVVFQWSRQHGGCIECGLPAAYVTGPPVLRQLCSVCAAVAASEGETITKLFDEGL